jgi:hypothetical protein
VSSLLTQTFSDPTGTGFATATGAGATATASATGTASASTTAQVKSSGSKKMICGMGFGVVALVAAFAAI